MSDICQPSEAKVSASKSAPKSRTKRRQTQQIPVNIKEDTKSERGAAKIQKSAPAASKKSKISTKKDQSKKTRDLKQNKTKQEIMADKEEAKLNSLNKELIKSTKKSKKEENTVIRQGHIQVTLERLNQKSKSKGKVQKQENFQLKSTRNKSQKLKADETTLDEEMQGDPNKKSQIDNVKKSKTRGASQVKSTLKRDKPSESMSVLSKANQIMSKGMQSKTKSIKEAKATTNSKINNSQTQKSEIKSKVKNIDKSAAKSMKKESLKSKASQSEDKLGKSCKKQKV